MRVVILSIPTTPILVTPKTTLPYLSETIQEICKVALESTNSEELITAAKYSFSLDFSMANAGGTVFYAPSLYDNNTKTLKSLGVTDTASTFTVAKAESEY